MSAVFSLIATLIGFYSLAVIVKIMLSWFFYYDSMNGRGSGYGGYGYNDYRSQQSPLKKVSEVLGRFTDPYLKLFSGVKILRTSNVDFSPVLALIVLNVFKSMFSMLSQTGRISLGVVLALVVDSLWSSLFSFILFIIIILLVVRVIAGKRNTYKARSLVNSIDPILNGPVGFVYKLFFRKSECRDDNRVVVASLIFYVVCHIVLGALCDYLTEILLQL